MKSNGAFLDFLAVRIAREQDMGKIPSWLLDGALARRVTDYAHPNEVLKDAELSVADKRAILSAWASDACAVESRPAFRWMPGTPGPVAFNHVTRAIRMLDGIGDRPSRWSSDKIANTWVTPPAASFAYGSAVSG